MMEDRDERDGLRAGCLVRHMLCGERSQCLLVSETVCALADIGKGADIVIREVAV